MNKFSKIFISIFILLAIFTSCASNETNTDFTVAIVADFQSISPGADVGALSKSALDNMNAKLYKYNPIDKVHEPYLASNISEDNGVYTITLINNAYFHNGDPVTSEDVVYSIKRNAGFIPEFTSYETDLQKIITEDCFKIIDDSTLTVTIPEDLNSSNVAYLFYDTIIVPKDYSEEDQMSYPISAGPYKFVEYIPGDRITFEKFDQYWLETGDIEEVTFKIIPDTSTSLFALENGEIDMLNLLPDDISTLSEWTGTIETNLANNTNTLFFNSTLEPFDDNEIVKAMKYAIDMDELISIASSGVGETQASVLSPYQESYYNENLQRNEYDLELSKNIMEAKGFNDSNKLEFTLKVVSENRVTVNMANMIKSYLDDIYIDVVVVEVPWSTYFQEVYINKDFESTILQLAGYDNPYKSLRFFQTDYVGNLSGYSNSKYDEILNEIKQTADRNKKIDLFYQAQQIIFDDAPAIFLGDEGKIIGLNKKYTGVLFYPYWFNDISKIRIAD